MVKKSKRDRSRSKTPEVPWELLLSENAPPAPAYHASGGNNAKSARTSGAVSAGENGRSREAPKLASLAAPLSAGPSVPGTSSVGSGGSEPDLAAEQARKLENDSWRQLVGMLCALRGDPDVEKLLAERHPELRKTAELSGAGSKQAPLSLDKAREAARDWFARGLRGSNRHGPAERTKLCTELLKSLKARVSELLDAPDATEERRLQKLLSDGPASEEGPLVCSRLRRDLEGSRYENLFISRQGPGLYILGDEHEGSGLPAVDQDGARIHSRVRVVVRVRDKRLVIEGFYHEGEDDFLNPARVPIGPFLTVYFEGVPLKEALAKWKNGPPPPPNAAKPVPPVVTSLPPVPAALSAWPEIKVSVPKEPPLPPGWEMRESRSKKGVYYYANPSKGLSQMERPRA